MSDPANAPQPGTPEYDAQMASKFEAGTGNVPPDGTDPDGTPPDGGSGDDRPDWLDEKFKTPEDLAKAYKELEAKQGGKKPDEGDSQGGDDDAARKTVEDAGLDYDSLAEDYATNGGQLSDAAYAKLEEAGIPRDIVDSYIAGQVAIADNLRLTAFNVVGGEDNYMAMVQWAQANMKPAEIEAFNSVVGGSDADKIQFAVSGLKARYEAVNGSDPTLMGGNTNVATGDVFESWAQVKEAMRNPKYASDPAYRSKVEAKLGRSNPVH